MGKSSCDKHLAAISGKLHKAAGGEAKHRPNYFLSRVECDDLRYELKTEYASSAGIPAVATAKEGPGRHALRGGRSGPHTERPAALLPSLARCSQSISDYS